MLIAFSYHFVLYMKMNSLGLASINNNYSYNEQKIPLNFN